MSYLGPGLEDFESRLSRLLQERLHLNIWTQVFGVNGPIHMKGCRGGEGLQVADAESGDGLR